MNDTILGAKLTQRSGRLLPVAVALVIVGLLPACALFRPAEPQPLELIHLETAQVARAFGEVQLRGLFVLRNPNNFEVEIDEVERTLRLQDRPILLETERIPRRVGAASELAIPARLNLSTERILAVLDRQPENGLLDMTLQLSVHAVRQELSNKGFLSASWHGKLLTLIPPQLSFRAFEINSLTPLQADYELIFNLKNPNRYSLRLLSVELALLIDNTDFGLIEANEFTDEIPPGQTVSLRVKRSQRLTRDDNQLFSILQKSGRLDIAVTGHARFHFDSEFAPLPAFIEASGRVQR